MTLSYRITDLLSRGQGQGLDFERQGLELGEMFLGIYEIKYTYTQGFQG